MEIHDKKQLAAICIERLKKEYPLSDCTLDYEHAWQLLVEVRLAAQCTDARVNVVVQDLFAKYPNVAALAAAEPEELEEIVRPCGLGRSTAREPRNAPHHTTPFICLLFYKTLGFWLWGML